MKKVLMLANHATTIYLLRTELVEQMINKGYQVFISSPDGDKIDYFISIGCKFIKTEVDRRGTNPKNDIKLFFNYMKILKEVRPDVVLTYTVKPNLYGGIACRLKKIPYIPNVTGLGSGFINGGLVQKIIKILSGISFRGAHKVMVQNEEDLNILRSNKLVKDNYKLIPGSGVNIDKYNVLPYPEEQESIVFNYIARIMKDKGIDEYLEAARIVKAKHENVVFNVIGMIDQEQYREVLHKHEKENIIKYYGFQKEMQPLIEKCSCTINPSYTEGMSNVLLESAASGRPIIASNIAGCREIVDEGVNGYLFEVKNSTDLTAKIENFIQLDYEQRASMGACGRKKVEEEFDRRIVIDTYLEQIKKI